MFWIVVLLFTLGLVYYKTCYQPLHYWQRKKVRQTSNPHPLMGDNYRTMAKKEAFSEFVRRIYFDCKERYYGIYQMRTPVLFIKDIELIKRITVKDFDHFTDHQTLMPESADPLWGKNLLSLKGNHWRDMRSTLSPAFTSSKMKLMFSLMNQCSEQLTKFYLERNKDEITLEMKDTFTRFANDVIATCAFGVEVDSLKERDNEFYLMGKDATDFTSFWKNMKIFMFFLCPFIAKLANLRLISVEVTGFFTKLVKTALRVREEQNIIRPDMIHLLMEARKGRLVPDEQVEQDAGFATAQESHIGKAQKSQKTELSDIDIAAQALIFFFAGFETVSTLMSFMSYELAINPDIQDKLVAEVNETRKACNGKINYEDLTKMKYMDMVISETLRKWPSTAVDRMCTKPYTIEPVTPEERPIRLSCGDIIMIPITGVHYDPEYFPNPEKFDPERFNDENKHNIKPGTFIPFGIGPRNCIGSRFALMEAKIIFYYILSNFNITVVEKTEIPLKITRAQFNINAENGFWVGLKRRTV